MEIIIKRKNRVIYDESLYRDNIFVYIYYIDINNHHELFTTNLYNQLWYNDISPTVNSYQTFKYYYGNEEDNFN